MILFSQCKVVFFMWIFIIFLNVTTIKIDGANVLAVLPSVWRSHYIFGRAILEELVTRHHHNVTLISAFATTSETTQLPQSGDGHITEIQINGIEHNWVELGLSMEIDSMHDKSIIERLTRMIYAGASTVDLILGSKATRNLLRNNQTFDLLIVDIFLHDALLGFSKFFEVPTVIISPTGSNAWLNQMTGNPHSFALDPSDFLPYLEQMSFWERSVNTLMGLFEKMTYNLFHMISQQAVYEKYFEALLAKREELLPHHRDLADNISLVVMNYHPVVQYPKSFLPNMIEAGGVHLKAEKLSENLQKFIEQAEDGVIYVSFGANAKASVIAEQKLDTFLHVFEVLNPTVRILLKWECEQIEHNPQNILISDWFPQQGILAHPNVKAFISAAGVLSIIEAIHYRTPMITIPILPEQEANAKRLERRGCAINLSYDSLNYDSLLKAVHEILSNSSVLKNIEAVGNLLDEHAEQAGSRTADFINLVIKTKGASYLRSHANRLGFLKSELIDVLFIILAGIGLIIAVPFLCICVILRRSYVKAECSDPVNRCKESADLPHIRNDSLRKTKSPEK